MKISQWRIVPMSKDNLLPITVNIPTECKKKLREIAARKNLHNQDEYLTPAGIAREIILRNIGQCELEDQSA
jgi:hypothetical protein